MSSKIEKITVTMHEDRLQEDLERYREKALRIRGLKGCCRERCRHSR